jgi:phosphoglycerol transferase
MGSQGREDPIAGRSSALEASIPSRPALESEPAEAGGTAGPARPLGARRLVALLALQAVLVAGTAVVGLGVRRDLRAPLDYCVDALVFLAQSKGTVENGWWWANHRQGAPSGMQALLFPSNTNVDQAFIWVIGHLVGDPMLAVTLAWLAMLVVAGWAASYCFRLLGASRLAAFVAGILYALSPYALYRNVQHFNLVTYLVPFPATLAVLLASGRLPPLRRWRMAPLTVGCLLVGFNYAYYSFFACFFIVVALVVGYARHQDRAQLRTGSAMLVGLVLCTGLNLLPSILVTRAEGRPVILQRKQPAEAELYGLKIRQLISPVFDHQFKPFRIWTQREASAAFPVESENAGSKLGLVASLGFLALLAILLVGPSRGDGAIPLSSAAGLTVAGVLLATVGGFGSLFNLFVAPDIRAYNRICPFLAVFALLAVAAGLDALARRRPRLGVTVAGIALLVGVWDQAQALRSLRTSAAQNAAEYHALGEFVARLEQVLPPGAMVLQLPFTTYLSDPGRNRMRPYDHLKPYLASRTLRWSYPAISNAQYDAQEVEATLDMPRLTWLAASQGFRAILIDTFGYADAGVKALEQLEGTPGNRLLLRNERYAAVGLPENAVAPAPNATSVYELLRERPSTPALRPCGEGPIMGFDKLGSDRGPSADHPTRVERREDLIVSGWAATPGTPRTGRKVEVAVDTSAYSAVYGIERPDVAAYLKTPEVAPSGFRASIPAERLGSGEHVLQVRLVSPDRDCYFESSVVRIYVR